MEEKLISSFRVNHLRLLSGVYVSRKGPGDNTTFDLRFREPNRERCLSPAAAHTIEHLGATYFRTISDLQDQVIYFGPMGCLTGFYLVVCGEPDIAIALEETKKMCAYVISHGDEIPGAKPDQCGNYSMQNLEDAKEAAREYLQRLEKYARTEYPEE